MNDTALNSKSPNIHRLDSASWQKGYVKYAWTCARFIYFHWGTPLILHVEIGLQIVCVGHCTVLLVLHFLVSFFPPHFLHFYILYIYILVLVAEIHFWLISKLDAGSVSP